MVSITLGGNALRMEDDDTGDVWFFSGGNDVTVFAVASTERPTNGAALTPAPLANGSASGYSAFAPTYIITLLFGTSGGDPLRFYLRDVSNQGTWLDTFAGAEIAVADIKNEMIP